jgi:subtilase family serine protease
MSGNGAGEGFLSGTFIIPPGWESLGTISVWVRITDAWGFSTVYYVADSWASPVNLSYGDQFPGFFFTDSGFPLTYVTFTPSTRPNLTVSVDSIAPGAAAGTLDVFYTVVNSGNGTADPFTVGFFVDPTALPGVGAPADHRLDVGSLPVGIPVNGFVTVTAPANANVVAFADVDGVVSETNEGDNLGLLRAAITGPVGVTPLTVEEGGQLAFTVPVNGSTRGVQIVLGNDFMGGQSFDLGTLWGNDAGEGFISGSLTVPSGWGLVGGNWQVWVFTRDFLGMMGVWYVTVPSYSTTELMAFDPFTGVFQFTGLPATTVSVAPPTTPNLRGRLLSITPSAGGTLDVSFNVTNNGFSDAGPFTVGIFVDPPMDPGVGATPQGTFDVAGLAVGMGTQGTVNVPGGPLSRVIGFVDLNGDVAELNESDNLLRLPPYLTGSPVVAPNPVELTGGITVTVPVNSTARSIQVAVSGPYGMGPAWELGWSYGNYEGQGTISGTFGIPDDAQLVGDWTLVVTVWDDFQLNGRRYVYDPSQSPDYYSLYNAQNGNFLNVSTFPLTPLSIVAATHPNLTVRLGTITEGAVPGTVDVPYTVTNATAFGAGDSTLGLFVDPMNAPVVGQIPAVSEAIAPLPAYSSASGTITVTAAMIDRIIALADVQGMVVETNEADNLAQPPPALLGPIDATPSVVDEGTLLTLTLPVTGNTFHGEVYLGADFTSGGQFIGWVDGNWENQGFITGSVFLPPGSASLGTVPIWVYLRDDYGTQTIPYVAYASVAGGNLAVADPAGTWTDSGIPLTYVEIIPASRPNLSVTIDAVNDMGDGTVNVDITVWNTGAGDAGTFDVGLFVDPAMVPDLGTPTSGVLSVTSLAMGTFTTGTVNVTGTPTSALFAYADAGNVVDEQSETDNLAWRVPAPQMTGQPSSSTPSVTEGSALTVTVPVSPGVRRVEVYVGGMMQPSGGSPAFLVGEAALGGPTATVDVPCVAPLGSAGSWYLWVATYDAYGLDWRGYVAYDALSPTNYVEYDPNLGGPPSIITTIPLTSLDITP